MASILKTDEIQSQNGGAVVKMQTLKHPSSSGNNITLDSSNNVSLGGTLSAGTIGSSVTGFTGIKVYDNWRLTANNTTTGNETAISANLERVDDPAVTLIGSPMSHISGVFTFPMPGIYLIGFHAQYYLNNSSRYIGSAIQSVISGTVDNLALSYTYINRTDSSSTYSNSYCSAVIDVSDTSTHKIQFVYESSAGTTAIMWGSTVYSATNFTFMRIGDT